MPLKIPNLDQIKANPEFTLIGEAIEALKSAHETLSEKISVNSQGPTLKPAPHTQLNVVAGNGVHHVTIVDNNPRTRNLMNFIDYDTNPQFSNAHTEPVGPGRSKRFAQFMGDTPVYYRSYAQYPDGQRSEYTYHGSPTNPTGVKDTGSGAAGPPLPPTTGSGTGASNNNGAGQGFGREHFVPVPTNPGKPPRTF